MSKITLGELIGKDGIENFEDFDLTEIQKVLKSLSGEAYDIAQAEFLQQRALFAADLLIDFNAKMIKTVGFLEAKLNSVKNKSALEYKGPEGVKITADMRKLAGESSDASLELAEMLAKSKGAKSALEKKLDLVLKMHYHFKEIANQQKQGIISGSGKATFIPEKQEEFRKIGW